MQESLIFVATIKIARLEIAMRTRAWKRIVTVTILVVAVVMIGAMQPMFFGVRTYFGHNPLTFLLPTSAVFIVLMAFHLYQTWPLVRLWFKKRKDKKKRDRLQRIPVLVAFVVVISYDIASAWYYALKFGFDAMPMESIRLWSWVATGLLAVHIWQRWRLTFSYFRKAG